MRKPTVLIALTVATTAAVLTGCSATESPTAVPSAEHAYLATLDRGAVPHPDDAQAVELGRSVCTQFDSGATLVSIGFTLMSTDLTPEQAGWMIGSAVGTFCPEHLGAVEAADA